MLAYMYPQPGGGMLSYMAKKRIEAFVRRGVRLGLYHANDPTPAQLAINSDDKLFSFSSVLTNSHHVWKQLLPDETSHQYNLRSRRHNLSLSVKTDDRNFIIRQLSRDSYWYF